jgi:hypothetical protein
MGSLHLNEGNSVCHGLACLWQLFQRSLGTAFDSAFNTAFKLCYHVRAEPNGWKFGWGEASANGSVSAAW